MSVVEERPLGLSEAECLPSLIHFLAKCLALKCCQGGPLSFTNISLRRVCPAHFGVACASHSYIMKPHSHSALDIGSAVSRKFSSLNSFSSASLTHPSLIILNCRMTDETWRISSFTIFVSSVTLRSPNRICLSSASGQLAFCSTYFLQYWFSTAKTSSQIVRQCLEELGFERRKPLFVGLWGACECYSTKSRTVKFFS